MHKQSLGALTALAIAIPLSPSLYAQTGPVLEEVIVTARKREENLQDTPIAITAISGATIEAAKLFNMRDIEQRVPNLAFTVASDGSSGSLQAFLRGVGQFDFAITTDPGVGLYIDGVYLARTVGANFELSDIDSIAVLRGPQGTLYGKNTIGGAISVTTRVPTGDTNFSGEVTAGEDQYLSFDGYLEFPVTENLAAGVSLLTKHSDGWQQRDRNDDAGNNDMWSLRVNLNGDFSDKWNSRLIIDYTDIDQNVYPRVLSDFDANAVFASFYNGFVGPVDGFCCEPNIDEIDRSHVLNDFDRDQNESGGVNWTNTWEMGDLTVKSITGYREMEAEVYRDSDNQINDFFSVEGLYDTDQFSQEFLLSNDTGGSFEWLVGAFYMREDAAHETNLTVAGGLYEALNALPLFVTTPDGVPLRFLAVPFDLTLSYDRQQITDSYAAFFNTVWHMNERTRLNVAARYTYDEKDLDMVTLKRASQTPIVLPGTTSPSECTDVTSAGNGSRFNCTSDWSEFSPKVGIDYDLSEQVMLYASVSQGFRSGVFNGRPTAADQISVADPETLTSYEMGFKSQLWNRRLQLNGAIFYNDYQDQQFLVNRASASGASALALVVDNAADSTMTGAELEFTVLPTEGLTIMGGLSWLDPEYDTFESLNPQTGLVEDLSGREFQNVPDWTANLLAQYVWQFDSGASLRLRGDMAYKGEIFYSNDEACSCFDRLNTDAFTTYNAGLNFVTRDGRWEFGIFGRNLTDEREINGGFGVDVFGITDVSYTEPRRYFASLKYNSQ